MIIRDLGATRPDFLDRAVILEFLDMKPETRRDERKFWRDFEEARPRILGAVLDATAAGLRNLPNVRFDELPRMADFAIWVNACEESLGMKPGEALTTYQSNRAEMHKLALESSPLYESVAKLAQEGFSGTAAELLARLNCMMSQSMRRSLRWPKAPNALSNALRRMASNLRAAGIEIQFSRADICVRRVVSLICASGPDKIVSCCQWRSIVASDPRKMRASPHLLRIFRETPVKTRWKASDGH